MEKRKFFFVSSLDLIRHAFILLFSLFRLLGSCLWFRSGWISCLVFGDEDFSVRKGGIGSWKGPLPGWF